MGASHTTLSSGNAEELTPELDGELNIYAIDQHLFPGSGRMMRTYRLRHKQNGSTAIIKSMWVSQEHQALVEEQQNELKRIQEALKGQTHAAPFLYWTVGNYRQKTNNNNMVRPISLVRPHMYTTLSDRLASRPFLTHVEKLWIVCQLLQALDAIHSAKIVHGFLTTENIGLSSWNWLVLVDISSYKARTALPDDDPSEYLYYFQELYMDGTSTTPREKRCYLAPERFYTPNLDHHNQQEKEQPPLTTAMDIFSAGCIIMETFLNGERAMDLGDLMEYRKKKSSQTLQQKLNKIEFSAVRAACRHMLNVDPAERLSANAYLERLKASELVPRSFEAIATMMERVTYCAPDARLAVAAASYSQILWETLGVRDEESNIYVEKVLGPTMARLEKKNQPTTDTGGALQNENAEKTEENGSNEEKKEDFLSDNDLFAETEALLKKLESLNFDDDEVMSVASKESSSVVPVSAKRADPPKEKRTQMSQSSLLIYLQLVLSTVRHVLRPASKLVALQLMQRVGRFSTDEARLQRIVPVTVSLLQDQDPLVRASAIQVLTSTVSIVDSFPPSDSKVFPQYIFKRVTHMITDPSLVVRLAFARSIALLAETSHRFLDISHAVRLYEAVGGGAGSASSAANETKDSSKNVFTDDVAKLLDYPSGTKGNSKKLEAADSGMDSNTSDNILGNGRTLISTTYNTELSALHETVSRWVVHITTDQSEHSSPAKRALLGDLARLCNFFGLDGVMAFILPQILSFLNDRKDWQLRAALFDNLPSVCHIIGRAATEHFVLPCLETALVDGEEAVISSALKCLSELLRMGLLSRSLHLGTPNTNVHESSSGLLKKYGPLLVHPSADVRLYFIDTVNAVCRSLGNPDDEVFVVPIIRPFLRFQPSSRHLATREGLEMCLHPPWTRKRFQEELNKLLAANGSALSPTSGQWTSIAFEMHDDEDSRQHNILSSKDRQGNAEGSASKRDTLDSQTQEVRTYLQMLAKRRSFPNKNGFGRQEVKSELKSAIEGSLKLAQQIKFPRQVNTGLSSATLPTWYSTLRDTQESKGGPASESAAIRSVSALGQIYGLSIMDQSAAPASVSTEMTAELAFNILQSEESKRIEAACAGEWGSETCLDPTLTDTSLLVTKLNALQVPSLPPKLSDGAVFMKRSNTPMKASGRDSSDFVEWKPKIDTMIATSRSSPGVGHTAPIVRLVVSNDQRFFVTGSYDGSCRVWELDKAEYSNGVLESSITYTGHLDIGEGAPRINDLAMVEGGHSVVSGASDGSIHVWRVDMVSSSAKISGSSPSDAREVTRVAGSSIVRRAHLDEGEVLAVNHFNTSSASIMTYATQSGFVHSWDLRCANEPFVLKNPQDTGYMTSMAMGNDRNWMVTGTSKGYIALWDLRFQQILKLWRHNRRSPVKRLATSFVPSPQFWTSKSAPNADARPFAFAACGPNECSMLDLTDGSCKACFRTIDYGGRYSRYDPHDVPGLEEIPLSHTTRRKPLALRGENSHLKDVMTSSFLSVNAMVGSIGASDHSFLITGGSDCKIRFWDFAVPTKCYNVGGMDNAQPRFSFDRIGPNQSCRLMLCRQPPSTATNEVESSKMPRKLLQGLVRPDAAHQDSIQDLKVVKSGLLSCSRDCTVKLWR